VLETRSPGAATNTVLDGPKPVICTTAAWSCVSAKWFSPGGSV